MESKTNPPNRNPCSEKLNKRFLPDTKEKEGNSSLAMTRAIINANRLMSSDSPINCLIRDRFSAPSTLRMPTSAERLEERAVDRFIKLIQAISSVKTAIEPSIYK